MSTLLIKNASVIDGTGSPGQHQDLLVSGSEISAVRPAINKQADTVIDGTGMLVTPGFIDIHNNADHYLNIFHDSSQQKALSDGITTIVCGHSGSSLAPLLDGTLRSVRKWGEGDSINIGWKSFEEFLAVLEARSLGVNFLSLVGHSTVRRALLGEMIRDLDEREFSAFQSVLEEALGQGAYGLSSGLIYNHSHHTPYRELKDLLAVVKKHSGFYSTELRNKEEDVVSAVQEIMHLNEESGVSAMIANFLPVKAFQSEYKRAFELISDSKQSVYVQLHPFAYTVLPLYMLLPAIFRSGSFEEMARALSSPHGKEEILAGLGKLKGEDYIIAQAHNMDYAVGISLKEFAQTRKMTLRAALFELMKASRLRAVLIVKTVPEKDMFELLGSEKSLLGSAQDMYLPTHDSLHKGGRGSFTRFLSMTEKYKRSLEWAVQKVTQLPAKLLGLSKRGVIAPGKVADLVLLRDRVPEAVIVSGQIAYDKGKKISQRYGKILRKHG
ncbi:MAG: amidohydrolase family protein [Candidatus Harrisonbacteria bacterium]|nr:amidohydrolase family protein [Candidatus Harrisonbacteria bacterium]